MRFEEHTHNLGVAVRHFGAGSLAFAVRGSSVTRFSGGVGFQPDCSDMVSYRTADGADMASVDGQGWMDVVGR